MKAATASAKTETVSEPSIVKTTPVIKEKPVTTNETQPAVKKEEVKTVAKTQQVNKPAETKSQPAIKEKPVNQTTVKVQEKVAVKNNSVTEQKPATVKADTIAKPIQSTTAKITKIEPVKTEPVVNAAADIVNRKIETIESVNYVSDSLVLTLYDNGEVDGDTVSVLMNGELIMPRVGLSTSAVRKTIYAKDIPDSIQIVMYAETLGSLPPNTGLLIVYDGTERHEIRFSGDLKKNAAIVFRKKEN
jgi:hypothetical protein